MWGRPHSLYARLSHHSLASLSYAAKGPFAPTVGLSIVFHASGEIYKEPEKHGKQLCVCGAWDRPRPISR